MAGLLAQHLPDADERVAVGGGLVDRQLEVDVDLAVGAAAAAFDPDGPWRALSASRRGRLLLRLGELIHERAGEIAAIEVRENGKLLKEMRAQLEVSGCSFQATHTSFDGFIKAEPRIFDPSGASVMTYNTSDEAVSSPFNLAVFC